jgi:oligopeptide transport system substrate-binding protein
MKSIRLIVLLFVALCSCQPTPKDKKELRINIATEPVTLDPGRVRHLQGFSLTCALFEGLTRMNQEGQPELALATHLTLSEDECTYTFFLRESKWTNGDRLTAHDFVYAWTRMVKPDFPGDLAFSLYDIKNAQAIKKGELPIEELGVKALDDYTLQVQLERRTPYFLQLVATPAFSPINEKVDRADPNWATNAASYVSNGPFSLSKWEHHHVIVVEKNMKYWDRDTVRLSHIQMAMVGDENTELQMFERGEIDWVGSPLSTISIAAIPTLKKQHVLHSQPMCGTTFIRINTQLQPFDRPEVRRMLSAALNRQEMMEGVTHGTQIPAVGLLPGMLSFGGNIPFESEVLEGCADLSEVTLMYSSSERNHLIAQAIQHQWGKVFGLNVKLEALESKVYYARVSRQDYQLAMGSLVADFLDPMNLLEVFKYRKGNNNTFWENNDYIELLDQAKCANNNQDRSRLLKDAETLLINEMPIIPLFHFNMLYMKNNDIENVLLSSSGVLDFKRAEVKR